MNVDEIAKLIDVNARTLWNVSLEISGRDFDLYKRMKDVRIGDLVVETTSVHYHPAIDRVGYLKDITKDENGYTTYLVERLNGNKMEWSNCKFIKILNEYKYMEC